MELDTYRTPSLRRALRIGLLGATSWFGVAMATGQGWLAIVGAGAMLAFGSMVEE